jgi:hypothetical protein
MVKIFAHRDERRGKRMFFYEDCLQDVCTYLVISVADDSGHIHSSVAAADIV